MPTRGRHIWTYLEEEVLRLISKSRDELFGRQSQASMCDKQHRVALQSKIKYLNAVSCGMEWGKYATY